MERKNALTAEKRTLEEKLSDFERKGNHWLELMRNWIIEANQAGNLIKQENLSGMKDFLVDIGSNRRLAAGMLLAEFKMPWRDLAETRARARAFGAGEVNLSSNSELWCYCSICANFFPEKTKRMSASRPPKAGRRDTPFLQRRKARHAMHRTAQILGNEPFGKNGRAKAKQNMREERFCFCSTKDF